MACPPSSDSVFECYAEETDDECIRKILNDEMKIIKTTSGDNHE